jgi:hypothetical protein
MITTSPASQIAVLKYQLTEDIKDLLSKAATYKTRHGEVKGMPLSTLSAYLRDGFGLSSKRSWKSLPSFYYLVEKELGFEISQGEGTQPRQRGSRELVYMKPTQTTCPQACAMTSRSA